MVLYITVVVVFVVFKRGIGKTKREVTSDKIYQQDDAVAEFLTVWIFKSLFCK